MLRATFSPANAWSDVLDHVHTLGATDRQFNLPARTDEYLAGQANRIYRSTTGRPVTRADRTNDWFRKMIPVLRRAYESAAGEPLIPMDHLAKLLRNMGHTSAYVESTGGNTATLYVGPTHRDQHGDPRYAAVAGPGAFYGEGMSDPYGVPDDFYVSADDDGDTPGHTVYSGASPESIVKLIDLQVKASVAAWKVTDHALQMRKDGVRWGEQLSDDLCEVLTDRMPDDCGGDADWREAVYRYEVTQPVVTSVGDIPAGTYLRVVTGKQVRAHAVTGDAKAYVEAIEMEYLADDND
jgi:hypothetical protein